MTLRPRRTRARRGDVRCVAACVNEGNRNERRVNELATRVFIGTSRNAPLRRRASAEEPHPRSRYFTTSVPFMAACS
jgi:hypothetical protein